MNDFNVPLTPDEATPRWRTYVAKWSSICAECGAPIEAGDRIVQARSEEWVHEECG
jgi:hypothetical protein